MNHFYSILDHKSKLSFLLKLLKILETKKVIVFLSTADQVNYFYELVTELKNQPD